jgi:tetratricopeptide (TPR) repeat protein
MFGEWENSYNEDDTFEVLRRYKNMLVHNKGEFFDLYEFECVIDFYADQLNFSEALRAVEMAMKQYPGATSIKLKHAQILVNTGKPVMALKIIRNIAQIEEGNFELFLVQGLALNLTGKHYEAKVSFEKALELCDEDTDDVAYSIAQSFMQVGIHEMALKYLLVAYQYNKENLLVLYDLALSYEKLDCIEKSILYYNKYLDIDPFAEHVWSSLGMMYAAIQNYSKADESFDYALALDPNFLPAFFCKADMLMTCNNYLGAIDIYLDLLKLDNTNTKALCDMGFCYEQLGDYHLAMKTFQRTLGISNDCADAWYGKGMIYFRQKKYNQSIDTLKKAILIQPENADYWFLLGEAYNCAHRLNKAIEAYSRSSELNPRDVKTCMASAQAMYKKKLLSEAIYLLMSIYSHHAENPTLNYRLAAYYACEHNLTEAQRYFKKALTLDFKQHTEMFRSCPRTRLIPMFRVIIDHHMRQRESTKK